MTKKYRVGVIFCGGCNPYFDRAELYNKILRELGDECDFFYYRDGMEDKGDLIVLINNCQSECLMSTEYNTKMLLINNVNYQDACQLIVSELNKQ